jgi:hypothetical protein
MRTLAILFLFFLISQRKLSLKKLQVLRPFGGLVTSAQRVPAQTKKKEKIGTIFCPKGDLAVVSWPKGLVTEALL